MNVTARDGLYALPHVGACTHKLKVEGGMLNFTAVPVEADSTVQIANALVIA